jgi:chromosome segregation ATPase
MSVKNKPTQTSRMRGARPAGFPGRKAEVDEVTRVAVSTRIWSLLLVLFLLLAVTAVSLFMSRDELANLRSSLQQAESKARESSLRLKDALDGKQQVIKELAAQGSRLAEFSRGEEKAKSALTAASSGVEANEKALAGLKASLAKTRKQIRALRKENAALSTVKAEMAVLTSELDEMRSKLEQSEAEVSRLRVLAEPYSAPQRQ